MILRLSKTPLLRKNLLKEREEQSLSIVCQFLINFNEFFELSCVNGSRKLLEVFRYWLESQEKTHPLRWAFI